MILNDLLDYFDINADLAEYLYEESFNEVFMKGELSKANNVYKIVIKTQKEVIHTMIIDSDSDFPVIISSELPNGAKNGIKFGKNKDDLKYI